MVFIGRKWNTKNITSFTLNGHEGGTLPGRITTFRKVCFTETVRDVCHDIICGKNTVTSLLGLNFPTYYKKTYMLNKLEKT